MSDKNYIEFNEATIMAYINGELSHEDKAMVDHWIGLSQENTDEYERIKSIWLAAKEVKPQPVSVDTDKALNKVLSQINQQTQLKEIQLKTNYKRIVFSAAAVIILLFGAVTLINFLNNESVNQIELTADNKILEDRLSDGTTVSLNKNSMLSYPDKFGDNERRVKLTGEAFFDVERNEQKPFVIDLHNDFYVKVLGTSFNINANEEDTITEVYVKTGKVEFGSDADQVILEAGEKGVMNNKTGKVSKIIVENEELRTLYWKTQELNFDHISLASTLEILEQVFNVEVLLSCPEKSSSQVVSKHQHESIDEILNVIASMHHLTVNKSDQKYTLSCD